MIQVLNGEKGQSLKLDVVIVILSECLNRYLTNVYHDDSESLWAALYY